MSKKDISKKRMSSKQSKRHFKKLWIVSIFLLGLLGSGIGYFVYQPQKWAVVSHMISSCYSDTCSWMVERKTVFQEKLVKVKQVAINNKKSQQDIHFEFYTALQNMQVPIPDTVKSSPDNQSIAKTVATSTTIPTTKVAVVKQVTNTQTIFDADQLQKAFKEEFNKKDKQSLALNSNQYFLQVGIFKNPAGAEKFRISLMKSGFLTKAVKVTLSGKVVYSVQVGPFVNKDQAILAQHQLQKKNVNGLIRKVVG